MRTIPIVRLLILFAVAFSLVTLSGATSGNFQLPNVNLGHALIPQCPVRGSANECSDFWIPSGSAMDTLSNPIFVDEQAEFANIQTGSPQMDLTDWPLTPDLITPFTNSGSLYISDQISQAGYFEIQFMLANNFWGCNMNFGNSACGKDIRQGIAHLLDKAKFASLEPTIAGQASAIDNPIPTTNTGSLPSPNPCAWDAANVQTGSSCIVGAPGGTAYHLATAAGANGHPWLPSPGSLDLCAAANHFIAAGIGTGHDANCVLTGVSTTAGTHNPSFFIRSDNPPRLHLGDSLAEEICYLFTTAYTTPCAAPVSGAGLNITHGPITAFTGFTTSPTSVNLSWWFYTAAYGSVAGPITFDSDFFTYNSQFVSGIPSIQAPTGTCSTASVPSFSANDYMYVCHTGYDSMSSRMEFAPCLSAPGDPAPGSVNNAPGANCPGTSQLTGISAGVQAADIFGQNVFTLPVFQQTAQFGYLKSSDANGWSNVINNAGVGTPNFFTWLNAWTSAPATAGTLRQAFKQNTRSVSPYIASTVWDAYVAGNVYDSIGASNPLNGGQLLNWQTVSEQQLTSLTYTPPAGTTQTFRFTLRSDMFFQDGRKVTAFDMAYSFLSEKGSGSFAGAGAAPMTGVTILGPSQFDVNVNAVGPTTLLALSGLYSVPGRYWTNAGASTWDSAVSTCTATGAACYPAQYTLGANGASPTCFLTCTFPATNMVWDQTKITAAYDPISSKILVGSGPFSCGSGATLGGGVGGCTDTGAQNPGVNHSYTLTRFGKGLAPASSISGIYFRSNGNLALWIWSQNNGNLTHDFLNFSVVAACFGKPVTGLTTGCGHFQQGIGAGGGAATPVGLTQVSVVNRFVGLNWVSPFDWVGGPPTGITALPPVLHEGSVTLSPSSAVGCPAGYDC